MNTQLTDSLVQTWVRVVDERGRAHLEARWVAAPAAATPTQTSTHTHAA